MLKLFPVISIALEQIYSFKTSALVALTYAEGKGNTCFDR